MTAQGAVPCDTLCSVSACHCQRELWAQAVYCEAGRICAAGTACAVRVVSNAVAVAERLGAQTEHAARLCCCSGEIALTLRRERHCVLTALLACPTLPQLPVCIARQQTDYSKSCFAVITVAAWGPAVVMLCVEKVARGICPQQHAACAQ